MASRPRADVSSEALAELLSPVAAEHGKSFLRYDENPQADKSKIDPKSILKQVYVANAIRDNGKNSILLNKGTIKPCMEILFEKFSTAWKLTPDHKQDWVTTMTFRLRNYCSAINAAEKKKTPPSWVADLPWSTMASPAAAASPAPSAKRNKVGTKSPPVQDRGHV